MQSTRTGWLLAATVCVLLAACTSSTGDGDDDTAGTGDGGSGSGSVTGAGNTQGITDDTIKISLISADLAQLTEQNLAPEIGNARGDDARRSSPTSTRTAASPAARSSSSRT